MDNRLARIATKQENRENSAAFVLHFAIISAPHIYGNSGTGAWDTYAVGR